YHPGGEGWMLAVAERRLARPDDRLAHVEMHVLTALGEHAVERPHRDIGDEQLHRGAFAAAGIEQRGGEAVERAEHGAAEIGHGHRLPRAIPSFAVMPMIAPLTAQCSNAAPRRSR